MNLSSAMSGRMIENDKVNQYSGQQAYSSGPVQPRLGYLFITFPKVSETFNLREMGWLVLAGCELTVFSLTRPSKSQTIHPEAAAFIAKTHYGNWLLSRDLLLANVHYFRKRPKCYLGLLRQIIGDSWRSPITLLKSITIFPKSVQFASVAATLGLDHLHATFGSHNATAAWIISRLTDIPYSITVDAYDLYVETALLFRKLRDAQFVTTISDFNKRVIKDRYSMVITNHTHVIRRGIDLNRFKPAPTAGVRRVDNIFRILCVGTLEIKKGQRYLIDAVARLINEGRRVKCSFVGDGPIGDILRRHVKKLGLTDCIIFLGSRTQQEVLEYLQSSDVFVLPSIIGPGNRMEGIPNALMEAMACELPVVATNLSGTPELVRDGENGLLVSPRDDRALALAIARLQDSPGLARSFGGAGRITVQIDFNQEINIAALLELYRRAIASLGLKVQCQ